MRDLMHVVIDRWQLELDTADRNNDPDRIFGGTPAIVFASFDYDEALAEWMRLEGPDRADDLARHRHSLVQIPTDHDRAGRQPGAKEGR